MSIKTDRVRNDCSHNTLTACSRCVRAKSMFLVYCNSMLPSCRWVRASTLGGGLKLNTACRHWIHILIRFDVRKFSASPSNDRYQASCDDAIGREVIRELELLNKISFLTVTLHLSTIVIITKNCQQNTPNKNQGLLSIACNRCYHYLCILSRQLLLITAAVNNILPVLFWMVWVAIPYYVENTPKFSQTFTQSFRSAY